MSAVVASVVKPAAARTAVASTVATWPAAPRAADEADEHMLLLKSAGAAMPDFSHLLPPDYRKDYAAWRSGGAHGAWRASADCAAASPSPTAATGPLAAATAGLGSSMDTALARKGLAIS